MVTSELLGSGQMQRDQTVLLLTRGWGGRVLSTAAVLRAPQKCREFQEQGGKLHRRQCDRANCFCPGVWKGELAELQQ